MNAPHDVSLVLKSELVRVVVVGSVDDGKSSLIGRLLYECDGLYEDQIASIRKRSVDGVLDFSLFTDGLLAEREQGITIDVAYRYFSTKKRKVIVADTPGHVQYTRNMATGASTADAVVILVDARLGVLPQTRRHAFIAGLLGIPHVAVAINKIDLVDDAAGVFSRLKAEVAAFTSSLGFRSVGAFPVSAVRGDNIVHASPHTPWHDGSTILSWLDQLPVRAGVDDAPLRFPVQTVLRPSLDYRGYAGTVSSGSVRPGDDVVILPSGVRTQVLSVDSFDGPLAIARAPAAVALRLRDDVDVARGDMIAGVARPPRRRGVFAADLVWLGEAPLVAGQRYLLKHTTRRVSARIETLEHRYDLDDLKHLPASSLAQNDIGRVRLVCAKPLVVDAYAQDRTTGAFILIDPKTNDTVAAGMISALNDDDDDDDATDRPLPEPAARSSPLSAEKLALLRQLVDGLAPAQLAWLSGYAAGVADQPATPASTTTTAPTTPRATILYGTQSGNARAVAERLQARLQAQGQRARLVRASDYATRELKDERLLLVVISTQGDGDPPEDSRGFCEFVLGKRAPALGSTRFAVLGLGDSTYPKFNHAARVLDDRLAALGAARLCGRAECDVDFAAAAERWSAGAAALLQTKERLVATTPVVDVVVAENATRDRPITATVLMNQRLTSAAAVKGAAKETRHVELSTPGLRFTAGDALGVWPENPPFLVDELLKTLGAARDNVVTWGGKTLPLSTWFSTEIEITRVTPALLKAHRSRGGDDAPGWQVVDVVRTRPSLWTATDLIAQLRPLVPRLYSIASSPLRAPDEVHLTVAHVDVVVDGRRRVGAASHFLSSASEEAKLRVFVEVNDRFRLPKDDVDIVMIGPGTGVAPFRAFLQEREERGAKGRNWLFFGEQRFTSTFLYQVEWQEAVKRGTLHKIDLAFSRDQPSKIYVQDRMREQARDLWSWLQAGAVVYVCGDAKHMAPDVERALLDVARGQGGFDDDGAADWLSSLREQGRYLRDIY